MYGNNFLIFYFNFVRLNYISSVVFTFIHVSHRVLVWCMVYFTRNVISNCWKHFVSCARSTHHFSLLLANQTNKGKSRHGRSFQYRNLFRLHVYLCVLLRDSCYFSTFNFGQRLIVSYPKLSKNQKYVFSEQIIFHTFCYSFSTT